MQRRPFAVGYFRLWQVDRTRQRRVAALESALNLADYGVVLIERSGAVTFCNRIARQLIDNRDGIRLAGARLSADDLGGSVSLRVAIDHVITTGDDEEAVYPLLQLPRRSGPPLIAAMLPVKEPARELSHVAAVLYLVVPDIGLEQALPPICKLYRLSNVETQLAVKLATGYSLAEAAKLLRVQELTARGYLKTIFLKTDVHRQADLMRLLLGSLIRVPHKVQAITQIAML